MSLVLMVKGEGVFPYFVTVILVPALKGFFFFGSFHIIEKQKKIKMEVK